MNPGESHDAEAADAAHADRVLDETIAFWQPRTGGTLTREDARQITENMTGFFRTLSEWDRRAKLEPDAAVDPMKQAA